MSESAAGAASLAHCVFFALKDKSPAAVERLVQACHKYLTGHPGTVAFAAGPRTPDLVRPVNDREFDVALLVVFESHGDHDRYQTAPRHLQFVAENKDNWEQVRVFDANVG